MDIVLNVSLGGVSKMEIIVLDLDYAQDSWTSSNQTSLNPHFITVYYSDIFTHNR